MNEAAKFPHLLVFADDWGRHPSSCQHLVRRLRQDYRVLWVNSIGTRRVRADGLTFRRGAEKLHNWLQGLTKASRQMWVLDLPMFPGMGNRLLREFNRNLATWRLKQVLDRLGMEKPVILTTLPYMEWLIRGLPRRGLVYYCTDDYSHWPAADRETLQEADRELSSRADLILAASQALLSSHDCPGRCHYFPHGVDTGHFARAQETPKLPEAIAQLPRPRVGYFGLIYEKLDFSLLTALAREYATGSLVMIGPVVACPAEFRALPNVHLIGPRPYQDLPDFIAGLDVLLLPYLNDPMIRQSGPLKLRECLASGKPTVSVDVPEVRILEPFVRVATNEAEFLRCVHEALEEPDFLAASRARQQAVAKDSWDQRAELLRLYLAKCQPVTSLPSVEVINGKKDLPRVLHLRVVSGKGGGPEKTILNSPRFLQESYALHLAYIRPANDEAYDMPQRARRLGVQLLDIPERGPADPRTLWTLIQEIQDFRPDILHAHDYKTDFLAVLLGRWFRIPVVTTLHGFSVQGGRFKAYYKLDRWALRHMQHVIAVSPDLHHWLLEEMKLSPDRCSHIDNAIDLDRYVRHHSLEAAKKAAGIDPGRLVIGSVGRLSEEKGFANLIRCAAHLVNQGFPLDLAICGEGEQRPRLEALIRELGCTTFVHLVGYRPDPVSLYEAMDVFALNSETEGLPNVLLEAMAMEIPVVATRVGGVPRLICEGKNGLLVPPGAPEQLSDALAFLLSNRDLRSRFGQEGRRTVEANFSFAVRMKKIRSVYDQILTRPSRANGLVKRSPITMQRNEIEARALRESD